MVGTLPSDLPYYVWSSHVLDIDECQQGRRVCSEQQRCVNTEGSYTCEGPSGPVTDHTDQCPVGYAEDPDTGECEGLDFSIFLFCSILSLMKQLTKRNHKVEMK